MERRAENAGAMERCRSYAVQLCLGNIRVGFTYEGQICHALPGTVGSYIPIDSIRELTCLEKHRVPFEFGQIRILGKTDLTEG